jgi:hypothetical protein
MQILAMSLAHDAGYLHMGYVSTSSYETAQWVGPGPAPPALALQPPAGSPREQAADLVLSAPPLLRHEAQGTTLPTTALLGYSSAPVSTASARPAALGYVAGALLLIAAAVVVWRFLVRRRATTRRPAGTSAADRPAS